jgi:hypothetical protein
MSNLNPNGSSVATPKLSEAITTSDEANKPIIGYLQHPSFLKLFLLNLLTLNFYRFYWFYENWDAIKTSERKNILPFWRALFSFVFIYPLFKRIYYAAKQEGYKVTIPYKTLATLILIFRLDIILTIGRLFLNYRQILDSSLQISANSLLLCILRLCIFIAVCDSLFWPIQKAINFYNAKLEQKGLLSVDDINSPIIHYFDISRTRFILFDILTARLYLSYWQYKNWQAIKRAGERHIWPFWRAIFSAFFIHALFKKIAISAKSQGYHKPIPYLMLAAISVSISFSLPLLVVFLSYFILNKSVSTLLSVWGPLLLPIPISYWIFFQMQKAINFYNSKAIPNYRRRKRFTRGEILLSILGVIIYLLVFIVLTTDSLKSPSNVLSSKFSISKNKAWVTFEPKSKYFEIKFPGNPSHEEEEIAIGDDGLTADYENYESEDNDENTYSLTATTYPLEINLDTLDLQEYIEDMVQSVPTNKLVNLEHTYVGDHRAVDFLIKNMFGYMQGRVIVAGQITYLLLSSYDEEKQNKEDYENFINSFSLKV